MIEISHLSVKYGGIHAVRDISFAVPEGKIVTLIGANGAGKSSTLKAICGQVKKTGTVRFLNKDISKLQTKDIVKLGITLVPEGRRVFPDLTVMENLILGAYSRPPNTYGDDLEWVFELFPRLWERTKQLAGTLSGGEQQMLAVGRALMSQPKLLMMDEPSLGLSPLLVKDIFKIIRKINSEGVTVLLIEQNARMALKIADYAYVMETGEVTVSGTGAEILSNDSVIKAYLGA